ncbi:vicilin-like seed storage At2g18540 [Olea europaea subsp. europaea]|uniref:Vicilin-like seed storage At2g18540 n=1 Tax=Olea europaea subsp. europaea TaxID=158383 RepID=A0A8S0RBE8_OLEEU|nr:vicilin-like seed storage At2g18540 [Olea europaea subsp. europaea]
MVCTFSYVEVSEEVIYEMLNGTKPPAIVHGVSRTKRTAWEMQAQFIRDLVGSRGYNIFELNRKKRKTTKLFNIFSEDKDFKNCNGWSTTVTRKKLSALKGSEISVFMVNLTSGSMMGPHWNPTATEIAVVLQGQGMIRVVCSSISSETECKNVRLKVEEGDVFAVPRFHPMAQMAFNNGTFVFMGFSTSAKKNYPQFLAGKASVLQTLDKDVLAASFNIDNATLDRFLAPQREYVILDCTSCAEEELRLLMEEMEKEKEAERKREEEEAQKKAEEKRREEEEARKKEEEKARKEEEERKKREEVEEEAKRRAEEEERKRQEEEAKRWEEAKRRAEEEERKRQEEEAKRKEQEQVEARKREEEAARKEEEERRKREEEAEAAAAAAKRREEEEAKQEEEAKKREQEQAEKEEEEAKRREEEEQEALRREEEAARWRRQQEEEAKRRAEEEARKRQEEQAAAQRREEEAAEAKRRAEEEARKRQEEQERQQPGRGEEEQAAEQERKQQEEAQREEEAARQQGGGGSSGQQVYG